MGSGALQHASTTPLRADGRNRSGVVLIAVLVVVTLLLLAAYQYAEMMTAEYKAANSIVRAAQARAAAASGVYYAAALLADPDSYHRHARQQPVRQLRRLPGRRPRRFGKPASQARFSVVAPLSVDEDPGRCVLVPLRRHRRIRRKINPNALMQLDPTGTVLYNALMLLPNMTDDVADAIVDWIDPDDDPRPNGAENSATTWACPRPTGARTARSTASRSCSTSAA